MTTTATLLAIETSCDETGVAVVRGNEDRIEVLAEAISSQTDIHALSGGVIPEVAAREHVTALRLLLPKVLQESGVTPEELDAIAVTVGPGLQPALAMGVQAARTLSYAWQKPVVPVHHLEGHIYSALLEKEVKFPALALIVSGGHTMLVLVHGHLHYEIIGSTRDDAAGEAFDKVARLLGLPYPGGPNLSRLATQGNAEAFKFARPMLHSGDFDFSFSGLKTEVLYMWREFAAAEQEAKRADVAASFQQAVVDALVAKTGAAAKKYQPQVILLSGGVAANTRLRQELTAAVEQLHIPLQIAPQALCGDNAVMIGQAGIFAYGAQRFTPWEQLDAYARLNLAAFPQAVGVLSRE